MAKVSQEFSLDAIYVGWPKCGSTWIFRYLEGHPDAAVCPQKDTRYYEEKWAAGRSWLAAQFRGPGRAVDICHDIIFDESALRRVAEDEPSAVVLIGLRDPARWLISEYRYACGTGRTHGSFVNFLQERPEVLEKAKFEKYIGRAQEIFGLSRLRFLILEDLSEDPGAYVGALNGALMIRDGLSSVSPETVVNGRLATRSRALLAVASAGARFGEAVGLGRAVAIAKRGALRKVVFRADATAAEDDDLLGTLAFAKGQLIQTREACSRLLDRDLGSVWNSLG